MAVWVTQYTKEIGSKVIGRLPIFAASLEFLPNLAEMSASFQRKERTPTVDSASVEFLNQFNSFFNQFRQEGTQDGGDSDGGPAGEGEVFRDESEEYGPFAAAGTSQQGRRNSAQRVQHERAGADSADNISMLLGEISTLMKQDSVHVVTAVCWLKALIHSHTSQLMALGSENLLANFSTCLAIIEYRVQHANSLSKGIRPPVDGLPANVGEKFRPPVDGLLDKVLQEESVRQWTDYLPMLGKRFCKRNPSAGGRITCQCWGKGFARRIRPPVDGLPANVGKKVLQEESVRRWTDYMPMLGKRFRPPVDGLLDKVLQEESVRR
ncbi:conserved hypothetical protein [Culex quinquefasciatus]|uniref:Uncharacterized protein n=1 Tax=Culex quinquefasciatus TaxID=7176 RepID=B0XDR0_CULQU|nr:conserved hypothetical protein [Culex quinquefasciatus]|eukprot:XP_001867782.1 conserved hypothetical protein [Culex quinquefasciatus]